MTNGPRSMRSAATPPSAVEAQISTEVLRQDPSRSPVHHESGAGKTTLPVRANITIAYCRELLARHGSDAGLLIPA
jgi:hypothetical protein